MVMSRRLPTLALTVAALALTPAAALAAPLRFQAVKVSVDGSSKSTLDTGDASFGYSGRFDYAGAGRSLGTLKATPKPGELVSLVVKPVTYSSSSNATIQANDRTYDCSLTRAPAGFAPPGIAAAVSFSKTIMRIQWTVVPAPMRCPPHSPIWSIPGMPSAATTLDYPLAKVRSTPVGKNLRLKLDHVHSWSNDGGAHELKLRGSVWLRRVG
jgi:hypothetical protein